VVALVVNKVVWAEALVVNNQVALVEPVVADLVEPVVADLALQLQADSALQLQADSALLRQAQEALGQVQALERERLGLAPALQEQLRRQQ
jgi:hypothetical protein